MGTPLASPLCFFLRFCRSLKGLYCCLSLCYTPEDCLCMSVSGKLGVKQLRMSLAIPLSSPSIFIIPLFLRSCYPLLFLPSFFSIRSYYPSLCPCLLSPSVLTILLFFSIHSYCPSFSVFTVHFCSYHSSFLLHLFFLSYYPLLFIPFYSYHPSLFLHLFYLFVSFSVLAVPFCFFLRFSLC